MMNNLSFIPDNVKGIQAISKRIKGPIMWRFSTGLKFQLVKTELNTKLLLKMTLHLHVKISTRYTELKFQLSLPNPR